ncbi:MAG: DUF1572 domain-containing protein [Sphingobacteriales bacterium]|nr:MAG: DUF1572 domain-containing protein [Sphingobacteriales bacterium]
MEGDFFSCGYYDPVLRSPPDRLTYAYSISATKVAIGKAYALIFPHCVNCLQTHTMAINKALIAEIQQEAQSTKKILERIPAEHFGWKPHEKSMSLGTLATHLANLAGWISITIEQDELDLAGDMKRFVPSTTEDLVAHYNEGIENAVRVLETTTDETMMQPWTLKKGAHVIMTQPKIVVLRSMCLNHMVHHRGQLTVYLRLLNIPVPGVYGPSADDLAAMAASSN